ncbi:MAG: hypothetical protein GY749_22005 [Desulfobacteraceae bacterium]|nr:hypothetical protein [Desulfobacteraceae bacterium]
MTDRNQPDTGSFMKKETFRGWDNLKALGIGNQINQNILILHKNKMFSNFF